MFANQKKTAREGSKSRSDTDSSSSPSSKFRTRIRNQITPTCIGCSFFWIVIVILTSISLLLMDNSQCRSNSQCNGYACINGRCNCTLVDFGYPEDFASHVEVPYQCNVNYQSGWYNPIIFLVVILLVAICGSYMTAGDHETEQHLSFREQLRQLRLDVDQLKRELPSKEH